MKPLLFPLPGNDRLATTLAAQLGADLGVLTTRHFPDGESYLRLDTPVAGREVVLLCTLDRPDDKFLPLLFVACTAKELGALRVGLIAPYLAYMRQDRRFKPGEAITSHHFARAVSSFADWLVTVDPHLHRLADLSEIYSIPSRVVHATSLMRDWIADVRDAVVVGPDSESEQWVSAVAKDAGAPYVVLEKTRRGDRDVEVTLPDMARYRGRTPVLVDDIISTAHTMIEATRKLRAAGFAAPVCLGVHAVFSDTAFAQLQAAGAARIVTSNTIAHESNAMDVSQLLADAARELCARSPRIG